MESQASPGILRNAIGAHLLTGVSLVAVPTPKGEASFVLISLAIATTEN